MNSLLDLQHKLQDTSGAIARLERALAAQPDSPTIRLNLESIVKRYNQLQSDFIALADRKSLDVCTYRLFPRDENASRPSLLGFSGTLHEFQIAFSALFDALKNGPRRRSRFTADVVSETNLGFGYAFAGSVGVVLTIEHERLLFAGTALDDAISTFFSLAKSPTVADIAAIGRRLGPAPLRAIYRWAEAHTNDGLGADISWRHGPEDAQTLFLQHQEFDRLRDALAATSEEATETIEVTGTLTGVDVQTHRFRFEPDGGEDVRGVFIDAVSEAHRATVPARYRARLEKTTKIRYSSDVEETNWRLLSLDPA